MNNGMDRPEYTAKLTVTHSSINSVENTRCLSSCIFGTYVNTSNYALQRQR